MWFLARKKNHEDFHEDIIKVQLIFDQNVCHRHSRPQEGGKYSVCRYV